MWANGTAIATSGVLRSVSLQQLKMQFSFDNVMYIPQTVQHNTVSGVYYMDSVIIITGK